MIRDTITEMLLEALSRAQADGARSERCRAQADGALPALEHQDPAVERPQNQQHGTTPQACR